MSQLRFWIVRLKPLAQPRIGLAMLSLGMVGVFAWTAWQYPELMSFTGINGEDERTADERENAENEAIGAEIDSLSLLTKTMRNLPLAQPTSPQPTLQPTGLPTAAAKTDPSKSQPSIFGTSFIDLATTPIVGSPTSSSYTTNATNLPNSAGTIADRTRPTQATPPFSLQPDPFPQPSSSTLGAWNQVPQMPNQGSTGLPNSGLPMPAPPNQGSTGLTTNTTPPIPNAYTTLTNPSSYLPIDAGVAPAVNPGAVIPVNVPVAAPVVPQVLPGADVPVAPVQPQQVFTAPRPLPGRFIGDGNINTFSNP